MENLSVVYALCQCDSYASSQLELSLARAGECLSNRNVLHVPRGQQDIFIFDYGVIVFWGTPPNDQQEFLSLTKPFAIEPMDTLISDEFTYSTATDRSSVKNDHIQLSDDSPITRLAVSHGIAQSIKLSQFEAHVQQTIVDTAHIPGSIAETGKLKLSRKSIAKLRGRLFLTKSDVMLHYDLLDVPEFFWENPELNHYYSMITDYLETEQRVNVLGKKLETIHELFNMMADEQKHKHSSMLEWIIIWLIAFEIVVFLVHDVFALP
jgi:uncharacterized Rmd1/YagE family protein